MSDLFTHLSGKKRPDVPHPRRFLQLFQEDSKVLQGQLRDTVSPACPWSHLEPPPGWTCLEHHLRASEKGARAISTDSSPVPPAPHSADPPPPPRTGWRSLMSQPAEHRLQKSEMKPSSSQTRLPPTPGFTYRFCLWKLWTEWVTKGSPAGVQHAPEPGLTYWQPGEPSSCSGRTENKQPLANGPLRHTGGAPRQHTQRDTDDAFSSPTKHMLTL